MNALPIVEDMALNRDLLTPLLAIPVLALSAHAINDGEEHARPCGCDGYLSKSLAEDLLFDALSRQLGD